MSLLDMAKQKLFARTKDEQLPLKDVKDQPPEDQELASFVRSKLEDSRVSSARVAQEGINLTNIAYLCGFDSVYFDGTSKQFKPLNTQGSYMRKNKVHVNRILPTIQNRLARLTKNVPRWDIKPNSSDQDDKDAARLAEVVLEQLWDQLYINRKRLALTMWLQQCGSSYFKIVWDDSLGKKQVMPEVNPETGETEYKIVAEGDIRLDVVSFFELFPDPMAMTWDEAQYVIHAKIRPIEYFGQRYERGFMVKPEDCWLTSLTYEARINSINTVSGTSGQPPTQMKSSAIEMSYYEKPSKKHPYGRHIIIANGVKLKDDILPIDEIPFVKFDDIIVGGKFTAESVITHLRPLQDQLNKGKSMRAAWLNRMLTGKMLYARGHNLLKEGGNDQSGEWIAYDPVPGSPEPHALQMPVIPDYTYKDEDLLKMDIDDTAGINEVSRGQMPSSGMPAIGMQLLVEQDDTRIGVEVECHEYSYADLGRILLKFVDKYYETDRLLKEAGQGMEYTVREFKGTSIRKSFDVHVVRGSTMPGSKVLKRQEIVSLHQQGYFGNPTDPMVLQNVLSMLEFGDEYNAWKRHSLRMHQIKRGIAMIEDDHAKPPVSEFDDHALWCQELDDYRISEKYIKLDEDQQSMVLEVMNEHFSYLQEMAAPQPDPDTNPELKTTTAAQEHEANAMSEVQGQQGEAPPPPVQ